MSNIENATPAIAAFVACLGHSVSGMTEPARKTFLAGIRGRAESVIATNQLDEQYHQHLLALCAGLERYVDENT